MTKDINKTKFPKETELKLDIFRECFREWFPVFLHSPYVEKVFIYDCFAGSGKDIEGTFGSPLVLLEEARGNENGYCQALRKNAKEVHFAFNEIQPSKYEKLKGHIDNFKNECLRNCPESSCVFQNYKCTNMDFTNLFENEEFRQIFNNKNYGKFVLLDQYGLKYVNDEVFRFFVNSPKTDFIFFISSSTIRRFQSHDSVEQYFNTKEIKFDSSEPKRCHQLMAKYFRSLIPKGVDYYLHHFTIQKGSNYRGLIFGSSHSLGMEKFLKVCWKKDTYAGESNCNVENDIQNEQDLFYNPNQTAKKRSIKNKLRNKILSKKILSNLDGLKHTLKRGCLPILYNEVIDELLKENKIKIIGQHTRVTTNIHRAKHYMIEVI
jgi:three-Cys-motif partner protein